MRIALRLLLTLAISIDTSGLASAAPAPLVLTHVTVINVTSGALQPDQSVFIEGIRIVAVGPTARTKPPKDSQIIDAHGKFLIPGLWDMHVHLAGINADPAWSKQVLLPLLLANGITGVRDMGGDLDALLAWKSDVESGSLLGPHIVASGPWLAGSGKKTSEQFPVANAEEGRAAVRELKRRGADFIKIITLPSREAFFAVADEAKKQGIPFAGHLPFEIGALEASNAGMRSIEHLLYSAFALSYSSKEEDLRKRLVEAEKKGDSVAWEEIAHQADATYNAEKAGAVWLALKKNGTWVTPTLASLDITTHPEDWKADDPLLEFVPQALAKQWRNSFDDARMKKRAAWLGRQAVNDWRLTGEMHKAGVALLAGSDSLDPFVFPGESLHQELAELVRAGFTPGDALRAATHDAAQFLGRDAEFGSIEAGKTADLVLLDANPLENIGSARKISAVIRGGKYFNRAALDKLLAQARLAAAGVN